MKQISQEETSFLFEWVKNWFPTEAKPKIAILLLNKQEWRQLYENTQWITHEEFSKRIKETLEEVRKDPSQSKLVEEFEEIYNLPKDAQKELMNRFHPHSFVKDAGKIDYWMNEVSGECFPTNEIKSFAYAMRIEVDDFYKPYLNFDFIIIISAFFNEEQKKVASTEKKRRLMIHNFIFHELIHVVESCNNINIFKTNNVEENDKITLPLALKYFQ